MYTLKPNFKVLGKELGPKIKSLQNELQKLSSEEAFSVSKESLTIKLEGEDFVLNSDNTITSIEVKDGYVASNDSKTCVVLDTNLTDELVLEGLAREMVRTVQSLRKEKDFIITDHINIYYNGNEKLDKMINMYKDYIMGETLAENIEKKETKNKYMLNDIEAYINVEKI